MKYIIKTYNFLAVDGFTEEEIYKPLLPDHIKKLINEVFSPDATAGDFQVECLIKAAVDFNVKILVVMNTVEQGNVYCCISPQLRHIAVIKPAVINSLHITQEDYLNLKFIGCGTHCYVSLYEYYILVGDKTDTAHVIEYIDIIESEPKMVQAIRAINSKDIYEI